MSNLATIEEVVEIFPHPDNEVEKLEVAKVLNFTCVVAKGRFKVGEKVILIQPDSVLPKAEWTENYKRLAPSRVKSMKLRGFISFGIVEKLDLLNLNGENSYCQIGEDVTDILGITKYDPPVPTEVGAKGRLPFSIPKTDETLWQNIRNLSKYLGQVVDISLKIDGQSASYYYKDGQFGVLGRSLEFDPEVENKYTYHIGKLDLYSKLSSYCENHNVNICLRGESYGQNTQNSKNNPHSKLPLSIGFYSVWLIDEMRYAGKDDKHYFINVCKELDLPTVPILEKDVELTYELIKKYDELLDKIEDKSFEGVVIKGKNFSFKIINKAYDLKK